MNLTAGQTEELDRMVEEGAYPSRAEAIRDAVRRVLEKRKLTDLDKKLTRGGP